MVLLLCVKYKSYSPDPEKGMKMRLHLSRATQGVDHYPGGRARGAGADSFSS